MNHADGVGVVDAAGTRRDRAFARAVRARARFAPVARFECRMEGCDGGWYLAEEVFWWKGIGECGSGYYCEECLNRQNITLDLFGNPTLEDVLEWKFRSGLEGKMLAESVPGAIWPIGFSLVAGAVIGFGVSHLLTIFI